LASIPASLDFPIMHHPVPVPVSVPVPDGEISRTIPNQ
jgi:hypothetical protein